MNFFKKSKSVVDDSNDALIVALIIMTTFGGFGLGRLSVITDNNEPISINQRLDAPNKAINNNLIGLGGYYVASKNGTKYHFPWCSGASRINQVNKIIFNTAEIAKKAGYSPASNCKGL